MFICLWVYASTFWIKKNISANWTWNQTSSCRGKTSRFVILPFFWCHISALLWTNQYPLNNLCRGLIKERFFAKLSWHKTSSLRGFFLYFTPYLISPGSIDLKSSLDWATCCFKPNYLETRPQTLMLPGNVVF